MVNFSCKVGLHKRSRSRARWNGAAWVSRCRNCGVRMRRAETGKWRVALPRMEEKAASFSDLPEGDQPSAKPAGLRFRIRWPRTGLFRRRAQERLARGLFDRRARRTPHHAG
jgi:hypothetical protein